MTTAGMARADGHRRLRAVFWLGSIPAPLEPQPIPPPLPPAECSLKRIDSQGIHHHRLHPHHHLPHHRRLRLRHLRHHHLHPLRLPSVATTTIPTLAPATLSAAAVSPMPHAHTLLRFSLNVGRATSYKSSMSRSGYLLRRGGAGRSRTETGGPAGVLAGVLLAREQGA